MILSTSTTLICFLIFVSSFSSAELSVEDNILILTNKNFKDAIDSHKFILVEFYAPWCGHCQALEPEYRAAAKVLLESDSEIRLAKVDATVEKDLAATYKISGYPSLKFFQHSSPVDYDGPRKADGIVNWLLKKTGPPVVMIEDHEDFENFIETDRIAIVGFFSNETETTTFQSVARSFDHVDFGLVSNPTLFPSNISESSIVIYKNYDEKQVVYDGENNLENISRFIKIHQFQLVSEFSQKLSERFFDGSINKHLIFFSPKGETETSITVDILMKIAKIYRGDILVITVDSSNDEYHSIMDFFGIIQDDIPCVRAVILSEEVQRFKQDNTDLTEESLMNFTKKFLDGILPLDLKNQQTPEDWNSNPVKVLTGGNFDEIISNRNSKKALVEFYAPWCGHCKALAPIWDQLGDHFKNDEEVIIGKVDSTLNEFKNIPIVSFPTIKFFPQNSDEIIEYKGTRDLDNFIQFIEKNGTPVDDSDSELSDEELDSHQNHEDL